MNRPPHPSPEDEADREVAAGLHAFCIVEGAEQAAARHREAADPAFAAVASRWRQRMGEIDDTAPEERPSAGLWTRIEAALDAPAAAAAPRMIARPLRPGLLAGLWDNLLAWRLAAATGAAAAVLAGIALLMPRPASPVLVAVLLTDANRAAAVVDIYSDGRAELVPLETIAVPDDRILQVWTLWDRARGPVSLGLLDRARHLRLPVEGLPRTGIDQLFEITLEPKSGSPTGRPTGPILMKGTASRAL